MTQTLNDSALVKQVKPLTCVCVCVTYVVKQSCSD